MQFFSDSKKAMEVSDQKKNEITPGEPSNGTRIESLHCCGLTLWIHQLQTTSLKET